MKLAKKAEETIQHDPRSVRDPVIHKRLELMVFDDAIPHTWGCMFYRFLRKHKLGSEDAIAGLLLARAQIGLPLDESRRMGQRYYDLTADEVRAAFAKWVRPQDFVQVVRGPLGVQTP